MSIPIIFTFFFNFLERIKDKTPDPQPTSIAVSHLDSVPVFAKYLSKSVR